MSRARPPTPAPTQAPTSLIWIALGTVYIVWGTTYLAIRVVNQTLPPLLTASVRFLISGAILYAWSVRRGDRAADRPGPRQWQAALFTGGLLLLGGNGGVVLAERTIPSGLQALLFALVPLWMALLDRVFGKRRLKWIAVLGLVAGFGGAALLLGGAVRGHIDPAGLAFGTGASLCWAIGSLYSRHAPLPSRPLVGTGMQMLAGGALMGIAGLAFGELDGLRPERFSTASLLGFAYLIAVGSFVGFTAYLWLLRNARTSLVSTYAFVNPVVAVTLGWLLLGETIGARTIAGGGIIVVSVALIIWAGEVVSPPDVTSGAEAPKGSRLGIGLWQRDRPGAAASP